ncbi:MAG: isocitrate/isopropylmalate family dehydrogenase, partial [Candidatus Omnitrophota bacterium]
MKSYKIGVIPGDGTGPEVVHEGLKVLKAVAALENFSLNLVHYPFGGEHYMKTQEILPESALKEFRTMDALYLGAIGHPEVKPG